MFKKNTNIKKIKKELAEDGLHFKKPTKAEGVLLLLTFITFYMFNDAVNIMSASELGLKSIGTFFGSSYVLSYQFLFPSLITSFVFMMLLTFRNIWKGATHKKYDMFVGVIAGVSYILMAIAISSQMMGAGTTYSIFWVLGGLPKSTIFHLGVSGLVSSLLYYAFVE